MMFQKKIDRAFEWLKDNKKTETENNDEDLELEKNDILAIIISALIVFIPMFLVLAILIFLVI